MADFWQGPLAEELDESQFSKSEIKRLAQFSYSVQLEMVRRKRVQLTLWEECDAKIPD